MDPTVQDTASRGTRVTETLMADEANLRYRLACKAFYTVFQRAQTKHGALLAWLQASLEAARTSDAVERGMLEAAAGAWQRR
jgi:hypothetical protein